MNRMILIKAIAAWLVAASPWVAYGATRVFNFDGPEYGLPDQNCVNEPAPPMFNRPGYNSQTAPFILAPAACGQGLLGSCGSPGGTSGNDSFLTSFFFVSPGNSQEIRFSWTDPTNDESWSRVLTQAVSDVRPKFPNPTVYLGVGGKIRMKVAIFGVNSVECENPSGALEFSLCLRETGKALPLGEDGGATGPVEFIGVDSVGVGSTAHTPVGGVRIQHSSATVFQEIVWEITSPTTVSVSVDGGAPVTKSVVAFPGSGDGTLSAAFDRGALSNIAIRKPADDDVTKKWYINIDDLIIESPANVIDPVAIDTPISSLHSVVAVRNIDAAATEVRLYKNASLLASATAPPEDFSDGVHEFTGLALMEGDVLTATQVVGGVESSPSAEVEVSGQLCFEDFESGVNGGASLHPTTPANRTWYNVNGQAFSTSDDTTLDGSAALLVDDGGFMNGVYAVYENVIPATGTYRVSADVHITEDAAQVNSIRQYQIGVIVNGEHRDLSGSTPGVCTNSCHNTSLLAVDTSLPGNAVGNYEGLTAANDSGLPTQKITTGEFQANQGDSLLIVFATNVETKWADVTPIASGSIDNLDGCESCSGFPPTCIACGNGQGTWNILPDRTNTSLTWGGDAAIRIDNLCLAGPPPSCDTVPHVSVASPIVTGQTEVIVNAIDPTATDVTVYANGVAVGTASTGGAASVVVTTSPLGAGQIISATQTIDGQEGCVPSIGPKAGDCAQIPNVSVTGPLNAGDTEVTVGNVDASAVAITVYDVSDDPVVLGTLTTGIVEGSNTVSVPALSQGQVIVATQTLPATQASAGSLEGCVPTSGQVVGLGYNSPLRLSLGIRETNTTGPVGADGGSTGEIEWVIPDDPSDPSDGQEVDNVARGTRIVPSLDWQTVTFDPVNDPKSGFTGDGALGGAFGVLEHLALVIDETTPDVGPYVLYIDNIKSGDTLVTDFEAYNVADPVVFRLPSVSGSTGPNIAAPPNVAEVTDQVADTGTKALRVEWRFVDAATTRWVRLTTLGTANLPNPQVDLTQPITMRVLLLPPTPECNTPFADSDGDGDVDQDDFGAFQTCFTGPGGGVPAGCACFDRENSTAGDGDVDLDDLFQFNNCATGPAIPWSQELKPSCVP